MWMRIVSLLSIVAAVALPRLARAQDLGQVTVVDLHPTSNVRFDPPIEIDSNLVGWQRPSSLAPIDADRDGLGDSSLDIAVASIALTSGYGVATCNTGHFTLMHGLEVSDWSLMPS
jgi:hypothetical protein